MSAYVEDPIILDSTGQEIKTTLTEIQTALENQNSSYLPKTGGTLSGDLNTQNVYPDEGILRNLGSEEKQYLEIFVKYLALGGKRCDPKGLHNGLYRGALLYDAINNQAGVFDSIESIHNAIAGNDFSNIYIGDYIDIKISGSYTVSSAVSFNESVRMVVAAIDYYWRRGDVELLSHHVVLIPENAFVNSAVMNSTSTTSGGYVGSVMHSTILPAYATAINSALGGHLLTFRSYLTNQTNSSGACAGYVPWTGCASGGSWTSCNIRLLSEPMAYGGTAFSSSGFDVENGTQILPYFALRPDKLVCGNGYNATNRCFWWLSAVANSSGFCGVSTSGGAHYGGAGNSLGVRPLVLFG